MRTDIEVGTARATVEGGRWQTDVPWLARILPRVPAPQQYVPDWDYALAVAAAAALNGRIVAYAGPPAAPAGAIA